MFLPRDLPLDAATTAGQNPYSSDITGFLGDMHVRRQWLAFFILWLLWGLTWFIRHVFPTGTATTADPAAGDAAAGNSVAPAATGTRSKWGISGTGTRHNGDGGIAGRGNRAQDVLRDLVLLLLSALIFNTLAQGSTYAVEILTWIFLAFAIFWTLFEASYESRIARFVFGLVFFGITLAIFSIALAWGWSY
ncbi:hypothetical protein BC937DRAFT_88296 [Endogone sp. FLAS-F59071]|nr:hypothetical protein BC937DRAFT_88296 [Endogone sp. FLAS-F59071]|eukprot:RUS18828.1 hypothetical protein BC937DRAFT_88296 [Endogone sp. FLAS-F59071]